MKAYLIGVYSRHRLNRRDLDPAYDDRHLDRFARSAWQWTVGLVLVMLVGGLADLLGLIE